MNILLIGTGGREHALAWKMLQSPLCDHLYVTRGAMGLAGTTSLVDFDATDHAAVLEICADYAIDLVVIGPEAPLVDGLADTLRAAGVPVFGPSKAAARLEGSKGFTKDLCRAAGIPTAAYTRFQTKAEALAGLSQFTPPYVIKADGLAAGKGVIIAEDDATARAAIEDMFGGGFGDAGASVVIEEFMRGEEVSLFALCDGTTVTPFGSAQDHKRVGEGDTGPNTGGMGAYSPARVLTPALEAQAMARIIQPTADYLAAQGTPYSGVLFAGLMLTEDGPKLIEYNCRFGDPECQALMLRFDGDMVALCMAVATGHLAEATSPRFSDECALVVVLAANGYPATPSTGGRITIGNVGAAEIFYAGVTVADGDYVSTGGRVLNVAARASSVSAARTIAYAAVDAIDFPDGFCRRDIGWREVEREAAGN